MRFRYLDGLRGLAALVVVIDHFAISFFPAAVDASAPIRHAAIEPLIQQTPLHVLVAGNFSVCIFFVLSGFVLSAKFFRTNDKSVIVPSATKRYLRLALPVIASVLLAYTLIQLNAFHNTQLSYQTGSDWLRRFWQTYPSFWEAMYHGSIGVFLSGTSDTFNTVLWTLKTELLGSFLVFAILLVSGKQRYRPIVYVLLGLLFIKTYYIAFIAGVALCDYYYIRESALKAFLRKGGWLPVILISLYLGSSPVNNLSGTAFALLTPFMPTGMSVSTITHIVGAIGVVFAILYAPPLQRLLSRQAMVYLGAISFSLYLTHFIIIGSLSSFIFTRVAPSVGYGVGFMLMVVPSLLLIWLVAHLFTHYVDKPSVGLSGIFYRHWVQPLHMRVGKKLRQSSRNALPPLAKTIRL